MKFSWKLINNFTNLSKIKLKDFEKDLALSGLEVDNIKNTDKCKDKIIQLSITTNREEIRSSFSLAREISTIFNIPITIIPIQLKYHDSTEYYSQKLTNTEYTHIAYIRIVKFKIVYRKILPKWLLNNLSINEIKKNDILDSIQEYIKIKWGQTFHVTNTIEIAKNNNIIQGYKEIKLFNTKTIQLINKSSNESYSKSKMLIFTTVTQKANQKLQNNEFFENMFIDSIKLITTIFGCRIEKYSHAHQRIIHKTQTIEIEKKNINQCLGYTKGKKLRFIEVKTIKKILKQLKLQPTYYKKNKIFKITTPTYRKNDLTRGIDIIEEIGRIYKFHYFFNRIKESKIKGNRSKKFIKVKQIRRTLNQLGFHEVINCCITENIKNDSTTAKIYNPIINTQKELRKNITENLINNYRQNIKHSTNQIEIFEIGKVFSNSNQKQHNEKTHLSGLIYNKKYARSDWSNKPSEITLFHFKNIIETFLETINSTAILKKIVNNNENKDTNYPEHLLKKNKKIGIYNKKNKVMIGIIGEINNKIIKNNEIIYIFEANLSKLIETTKLTYHLRYVAKQYSHYPSVTRDISIKVKKYTDIQKIKQLIIKNQNKFLESIDVFNEYININDRAKNEIRYVGLRITYRSHTKTLNSQDIMEIDKNLKSQMKELQAS
uniref:phenylalanine--tRNA ligase n=1 Tax=Periphykon beckeri TaxID=2006982 RepID=A0A1Z1M394_9FLOR|nr:Phenylalanine-tRNA ligase beta subunit [Periphykon beckeri]ARW60496.1 Phenylalanine-tRNA ligase beta subunit [Periphykon beckeri]